MGEVTDAGVAELAQLGGLQDLELQFAWQFGDAGVAALTALTALSRLDLMYRCVRGCRFGLVSGSTSCVGGCVWVGAGGCGGLWCERVGRQRRARGGHA